MNEFEVALGKIADALGVLQEHEEYLDEFQMIQSAWASIMRQERLK